MRKFDSCPGCDNPRQPLGSWLLETVGLAIDFVDDEIMQLQPRIQAICSQHRLSSLPNVFNRKPQEFRIDLFGKSVDNL